MLLHGRVEMQFPDNFHYDGFADKNELTGEAVIKYKCAQYHGEVVQGAAEGLGALTLEHATYEGIFRSQPRAQLHRHFRCTYVQEQAVGTGCV